MNARNAERLASFLVNHPGLLVLTGAGCSISAGIPAYRDSNGVWQRSNPIMHTEFVRQHNKRQRYWARSYIGYPLIRDAIPTPAHTSLTRLEQQGLVRCTVTQNVDNLHQKAGQANVIDLHGNLRSVSCLQCHTREPRDQFQERLAELNAAWTPPAATPAMPDGDSDLSDELIASFRIPTCQKCDGVMKPDVVFFGGSIPKDVNASVAAAMVEASGVLAIGSSLKVFSGYRICREASRTNKPLAILNPGPTRADELASLRLTEDSQHLLPAALELAQSF